MPRLQGREQTSISRGTPRRGGGRAPHSGAGLQKRKVQARCVRVRAARQPVPSPRGRSRRGRSRAWLPAHVRCSAPCQAAECAPGRLGSGDRSPAGGDARQHPRTRLCPARTAAAKFTPPQGPGRGDTESRDANLLRDAQVPSGSQLRAPPRSGTVAPPSKSPRAARLPSGGGKDLPSPSGLCRLPWREGARGAGQWQRRRRRNSRAPAAPQQPTWAFWCAPRSGTAFQPPGRPALPGNGQAGSQWGGPPLPHLHRPAPFFHPPSPGRRRRGGASVSSAQRIIGGTGGRARGKGEGITGQE